MVLPMIPPWAKAVGVALALVGILFFISRQTLPRDPFRYGPKAAEKLRRVVAVSKQSYERARRAGTPYEQLLHIQWGLAFAKAGRTLGRDVESVSQLCGLDLDRFIAHLENAERLCVQRIEQAGAEQEKVEEA